MGIYEKTGDVDIKIKIGSIIFNILLTRSFFNPDDRSTTLNHNHSLYEVHFQVAGKNELQVCDEKIYLLPGTYCLIGPSIYHAHKPSENGQQLIKYCLRFDFKSTHNSDVFTPISESREIAKLLSNFKYFYAADEYGSAAFIKEIHREFDEQQFGYYSRIQSLFVQIIINILRSVSSEKEAKYGLHNRSLDERRSEIIEQFFAHNYNMDITPAHLAKKLNISHSQLNRILKKLYNVSFKQKLLETRIEIAKDLLKADYTPIYVIAEKVGYCEVSCFSNIFKSKAGVSPQKYRLTHKLSSKND